ncbi:MAG: helix-turn-helix transcriptional regulator [Alteromonadaceae bacterium]|nr:helix-turn-helix transcriptional regulator [Alteromonadaceae bacterium]
MHYVINTIDQLKMILTGYRKSRGFSQKDMAVKLGVSQQTYQVLESNPQRVTVERLFKVLTLLRVKLILSDAPLTLEIKRPNSQLKSNSVKNSSLKVAPMRDSSKKEEW